MSRIPVKLEAVIVCKDYSDFLEHTLPTNVEHFDRLVVVTHPDDKKTQHLCTKFGVDFVDTMEMHDSGDKFNKGRAINLGLSHLRHEGWLFHLDADVLLPHKFRQMIAHQVLDPLCIYGADRLNVANYEHWMEHRHKTVPQHQYRYMVTPPKEFPIASRLLHQEYGYCPIGYFQMWHSTAHRKYPIVSGSAEQDDVLFAVQWPRHRRVLLPQFFVYHLESEQAKMGANWQGRTTKPFGPSTDLEEESHRGYGHKHHPRHHKHHRRHERHGHHHHWHILENGKKESEK
jgi:hypothetical protein